MSKKSVLIMCNSDATSDPRPNRMIHCLREAYEVSVLAKDVNRADVVNFYPLHQPSGGMGGRVKKALWLKSRQYDRYLWPPHLIELARVLRQKRFDLIISHDLTLLPLAFEIQQSAKVFFDAREYYPREYDDQFAWRMLFKGLNEYLCRNFMTRCDQVITVSEGLANEYRREYGVESEVVFSHSVYHALAPTPVDESRIRMIHHGAVAPSRRIEKMIQLVDHLDQRFTLDLMLVAPERYRYFQFLKREASKRPNVRIIPPVHYTEIVPFTNHYDIGLFYLEPSNFSLKHAMPNKLFEFVQARLAIAVTPVEMRTVVEKYDCGVVSASSDIKAMATQLNLLTAERIAYYKQQSHRAAEILNAKVSCQQVRRMIRRLLGEAEAEVQQ